MTMSLNTVNDEKILNLAREARNAGALVQLVTDEFVGTGRMGVDRTITITYRTHSTEAKVLGRKRELEKEPSITEQRQQAHADVVNARMAMRAKVLLLNNRGLSNSEIADLLDLYESSVVRLLEVQIDEDDFEVTAMFENGLCEIHRKSTDEYRQYKIGDLVKLSGIWETTVQHLTKEKN